MVARGRSRAQRGSSGCIHCRSPLCSRRADHVEDTLIQAANLRAFEAILVTELLPLVKQRYRVSTDPRSWAIAGLSLGGELGMFAGLKHPELFRTAARTTYSSAAPRNLPRDLTP